MQLSTRTTLTAALVLTMTGVAEAQQPVFTTPGMPQFRRARGQTDRFSSEFNPAIGAVLDGILDWLDTEGGESGLDAELRTLEVTLNGRVDPRWWAYAVVVASEEGFEIEEAAAQYTGFDSHTTVRAGRFFVDFGKQMQSHVHDLPYTERPGVLAEYLGAELPGVGVQIDHWWATSDTSALRASFGLFGDLEGGHEDDEEEVSPALLLPERKDVNELALTARVTQFLDVGERGIFQWGASARFLPEFALVDETNALDADSLSNTVAGLDLTYGTTSDDGLSGWTFSGEYLVQDGDLGASPNGTVTALDVLNDSVTGFYAWGERRFDRTHTVGVLYSQFEHPEADAPLDREITGYYTRNLSEFARLRFALSQLDSEENGDSTRFVVQLTTYFGPHAHGVNW